MSACLPTPFSYWPAWTPGNYRPSLSPRKTGYRKKALCSALYHSHTRRCRAANFCTIFVHSCKKLGDIRQLVDFDQPRDGSFCGDSRAKHNQPSKVQLFDCCSAAAHLRSRSVVGYDKRITTRKNVERAPIQSREVYDLVKTKISSQGRRSFLRELLASEPYLLYGMHRF